MLLASPWAYTILQSLHDTIGTIPSLYDDIFIVTREGARKGVITMISKSIQEVLRERIDPVLEAIITGLIETGAQPATGARKEDAVTKALTEALMVALITPPSRPAPTPAEAQLSPFGTTLANALAVALAPALAESLAPAIVTALSKMTPEEGSAQEKSAQEKSTQEGSLQEGSQGGGSDQPQYH